MITIDWFAVVVLGLVTAVVELVVDVFSESDRLELETLLVISGPVKASEAREASRLSGAMKVTLFP